MPYGFGSVLKAVVGITLLAGASTGAVALAPGDRVDNFRLLAHDGTSHELYYYADAPAVVLLTHRSGCAIDAEGFNGLRSRFRADGVEFLIVNSTLGETREGIAASVADLGLNTPVLMDTTQIIGESMTLRRAGEVVVMNPRGWTMAYRGAAAQAASAIDALITGQPIQAATSAIEGCDVAFPELANRDKHANISYSQTIAPMLKDNCVTCHREGGIGPWAMTNYDMVRGFAPMIREVVRTQRMPPWHADPHYGEFANDRSLSEDDVRTLVHWVEAGAPRGEGADPLLNTPAYPEWALGEPDVIIEIPAEDVPATGVVDYKYKHVANPLDEDVWVRATEIIPGDRAVLHHVITRFGQVAVEGPRAGRLERGGGGLGGYVPGATADVMPEDTGTLLPASATFEFQMHYTPSGKATTDVSRMGIYLYDQPPKHQMGGLVLANGRIKIPPHAPNHAETMARVVEKDSLLYNMLPHAHFRGKASEFVAHYPDGNVEKLLSVPNYDFNWQTSYELATAKFIPAGTKIVHRTWWDNSARNPANPDPTREVPWGRQSWDEMLFGAIGLRELKPGEKPAAAVAGGGE